MPTVAELDVQINAKDDASATIMALDALLKELDGDDVDIDVTANTAAVQEKIRELLARLRELDASDPDIDIDINTGGAAAEIAALRAELAALRDETVRIRMNSDEVRRASSNMNEFRNSATQASRSMRPLTAAVLALGTALIPIGAVAIGGIAALATAFAAAGIGAGLFAAVAITAFGPVGEALKKLKSAQEEYNKATTDKERDAALEKTKAIMDGLDPSVRKMVQSVLDFKSAWRDFAEQFQPQIFQIAQEGLAGLTKLLPSLAPMVQGASNAFLTLERSLVASLGSPWWQSWMTMMGAVMQPLIEGIGKTFGNLATGFAGLIAAFMPLTLDFVGGMERMSKSFADWAKNLQDNKGFQDFINYIRENTPLVIALIGSIVDAFVALVRAGAPLGEALVVIATNMFRAMAAFQQAHPQAATLALALIAILAVAIKLAGPLLTIGRLFTVLGSALLGISAPVLAVIAVIALLVGAFIYAYKHFEGFRDLVDTVAGAIADFAVDVYDAIVVGIGAVVDWLVSTFGPAVEDVMDFAVEQFDKIVTWANENAATFQAAWQTIIDFVQFVMDGLGIIIGAGLEAISAVWNAIWPTLSEVIRGVWEAIKGIISGALDIILGAILFWAGVLAGDWGAMWDGIVQIARGMWEIIAGIFTGGFIILQAIAVAAEAALMATLGLLWDGIVAGFASFWTTITAGATAAWTFITTIFTTAQNGIQDGINAFWAAIGAAFVAGWALLIAGWTSFWSTLTGLISAAWTGIVTIFTTAQNTIQDGINAFWAAVLAIFVAAWNGIVAGMSAFWATLTAGVSAAMAGIQAIISAGWAAIQALISAAMAAIQAVISAAWTAIQAVISAAMNAIQAVISAGWAAIQAAISAAMNAIQALITAAWAAITAAVRAAMTAIQAVVTAGWAAIQAAISAAMNAITNAIQAGMAAAVNVVQNGISQMIGIVTGAIGQFASAGASMMSGLAEGIRNGIGAVVGVVGDAMSAIGGLIPQSPAKTGPFSGTGYTMVRGRVLMTDFQEGLMDEKSNTTSAMAGLMRSISGEMALDGPSIAGSGSYAGSSPAGGYTITIAPGAIVLQVGDGVTAGEARTAFDGAAASLADELLTAIRRR